MAWTLTLDETGGIGCNVPLPLPRPIPLRFTRATEVDHDVPVVSSDSTILMEFEPCDAMHDLDVWVDCTCAGAGCIRCGNLRGPIGRLLGCSGSSFVMSGKKMGKLQIGEAMRSKGLTSFDAAFCIPMADSVPAKQQCYYNCKVQHQLDALGHVRALPSIMAFDAHLDLYSGPNALHMRRGAAIEFLSTLLQLLPKRRCLLLMAGWNSNCDTREFREQASFIGAFARIQFTPTTLRPAAVVHFLRKLGVDDPQVERSSIPARRLGGGWRGNIVVKWVGGEFRLIHSISRNEDCIHTLMALLEAYVNFMNGGGPPDYECCWDLPPLPSPPPLPVQPLQQQFRPLPHWIQWLGDDKNVHMRDFSLAESTNQQMETQLVGNILGIQGLNSAAAKAGKINAKVLKWLPNYKFLCQPEDSPAFRPLGEMAKPTLCIFHSGLNCGELQRRRCTRWAEDLGWTACSVRGANMYDQFPQGKGCKCTFSWVMAQLPKLMAMLEPFPDSAVAVIVEDSVHLTRLVTPDFLYSLYSQYGNVWAGGVMLTSKGNGFELVDGSGLLSGVAYHRNETLPNGSKLVVGSKAFWKVAQSCFLQMGTNIGADAILQILTLSGHVRPLNPMIGGRQPDFTSTRCTKDEANPNYGSAHTADFPIIGELMPLYTLEELGIVSVVGPTTYEYEC